MPNIIVKIPEGAFDEGARKRLAAGITEVARTVEQIGDDPRQQFLTWVALEEVKAGYLFAGGNDPLAQVLPVIVFFYPPAGVIDDDARANAVSLIQKACMEAKPEGDPRMVMSSVIISDVADGTWGVNGTLWQLADFAKAAGYKQLRHLVV